MNKMEDLDFSKLLQDAEQLTAEIETNTDLPRVQRNLRQVLEAGQQLLSRTSRDESLANAETKASVFLGTRGVDITNMGKLLEPLYLQATQSRSTMDEPMEDPSDVDIESYLKNERMNLICSQMDHTYRTLVDEMKQLSYQRVEQDWQEEKLKILSSLSGNWDNVEFDRSAFRSQKLADTSGILSKSELTYAYEFDQYNNAIIHGHSKPVLLDRIQSVAKTGGDKNVEELWASVHEMIAGLNIPGDGHLPVIARRSNPRLKKLLICRGKRYLEKAFFNKLRSEVWKNLGKVGNLGGVPAVLPMVKHYIMLKNLSSIPGLEMGAGDIGPVWVVIYLCLRCGRGEDAVKYMREIVGNNEFAAILEEYSAVNGGVSGELSKELETKVKMEYRRVLRNTSRDPFKRLIYCILGACDISDDHSEVAARLDDYLWLKLSQIRDEADGQQRADYMSYQTFQELISIKYGEAHFDAFKQPFTYFQALFLTGQFETAVDFLSRVTGLRSHAVHLAIVLNELSWLIVSDMKSAGLSSIPNDPNGLRSLNLFQLVVQYAKHFQGVNTKEALNYLFALRNMKDSNGTSLFSICVSDLAVESRDFGLLFGIMNVDGCRSPGLLESMGLDIKPIVEFCANESENSGMLEDAVFLYDIIGNHETALKVLVGLISLHVSAKPLPDSPRERIQDLAIILAERYQKQPPDVSSKFVLSTFYILVDFMTFFDEYFAGRNESCLQIIEKVKVIPLDKEDVDRCVVNFQTYADEIRRCIPDLILSTIDCLLIRFRKLKAERRATFLSADSQCSDVQILSDIKAKSKALVTYCGLVPYFMSGDVYTKVMQVEVQMI